MIQLQGVRKQFGPQVLFEDLTWRVPRLSRTGLVGPNGAGKTTLLRLLTGDEAPDAGSIRRASGLRVGYLPQEVETVQAGSVLDAALSGASELGELESELRRLEKDLEPLTPDDPRLPATAEAYGRARHRFEQLGGDRVESRARAILTGLGVPASRFHEPLASLSGGWRMRVVLARLLLGAPDLLLLDEPTNHLDLEATSWLEGFLAEFDGAFLVVSHDRYFLNRMVRTIVELDRSRLEAFPGDYDHYLAQLEARAAWREKAAREQARQIAHIERFVERFRYKASKARQVQSRLKRLSGIQRIETPSRSRRIHFDFPPAPRSGDVVARLSGVTKAFGDREVYRSADLIVRRGERIALVGPNGTGKSTLLKLLAGRLVPDGGELEVGHAVSTQYFAQHQLEALDPGATVLEEIEKGTVAGDRPRLRKLLGCFLFSGDDVDKKVAVLSGGEKTRLALARLLLRSANLLLLDEPTNHLDLRSREVLEEALDQYEGTLIVISHDRYFINRIATSVAEIVDGRILVEEGDYDSWHERRSAAPAEVPREMGAAGTGGGRDREIRRLEAEQRNQRYRERRAVEERLEPVEEEIAALEEQQRSLTSAQTDPEVFRDPSKARDVARQKAAVETRLADLYARWEDLAADMPG